MKKILITGAESYIGVSFEKYRCHFTTRTTICVEYKFIFEQAKKRGYEEMEKIVKAIDKAKERLEANVNFDIAVELMLLAIKENRK